MYVNGFWLGVLVTILVETIAILALAVVIYVKERKR